MMEVVRNGDGLIARAAGTVGKGRFERPVVLSVYDNPTVMETTGSPAYFGELTVGALLNPATGDGEVDNDDRALRTSGFTWHGRLLGVGEARMVVLSIAANTGRASTAHPIFADVLRAKWIPENGLLVGRLLPTNAAIWASALYRDMTRISDPMIRDRTEEAIKRIHDEYGHKTLLKPTLGGGLFAVTEATPSIDGRRPFVSNNLR